jgi:hypothetical protein
MFTGQEKLLRGSAVQFVLKYFPDTICEELLYVRKQKEAVVTARRIL